jgi:D-alanyl-D-alanine dipeptidase
VRRATTTLPGYSPALLLTFLLACAPPAEPDAAPEPLARATQLVLVRTADWDASTGELHRFERDGLDGSWRPLDGGVAPTAVVIGRSGLGWGVGFDSLAAAPGTAGPRKREGDGRSPAGAFALDRAFGFAPADSMTSVGLPYLALGPGTECVDDTGSTHYASIVDREALPEADWRSAERMRSIPLYRLGVVADYNTGAVPGRGSCIFLHLWDGPASTTSGCTAMAPDPLTALVAWLDADARPALVQLPAEAYEELRSGWGLPSLDP